MSSRGSAVIGNLTKGNDFAGLAKYLFSPATDGTQRAELLGGTLGGATPNEIAEELLWLTRLRKGIAKPVRHLSLSIRPGEHLTNGRWLQVARQVCTEMGWDSYAVIQHSDKPHEHVHILASRVRADGSLAREYFYDYERIERVLRVIEEQQGLEVVPSPTRFGKTHRHESLNSERMKSKERSLVERTKKPSNRQRIRAQVDSALLSALEHPEFRMFPRFLDELRALGVEPLLNIRGSRITGLSFTHQGDTMKGSNLGKAYSFANLADQLLFDEAIDLPLVSPQTVLSRATAHLEKAHASSGNPFALWSARANRKQGTDISMAGGVAQPPSSRTLGECPGMGNLARGDGQPDGNSSESNLGGLGRERAISEHRHDEISHASGLGRTRDSSSPSECERTVDLCGCNSNGIGSDRISPGSDAGLPGITDSTDSRAHGEPGRIPSISTCDADPIGGYGASELASSKVVRMGSASLAAAIPPMDSTELQRIAEESQNHLSHWFMQRSACQIHPDPQKSTICANDGSWVMELGPCRPEDLPGCVEHLADQELAMDPEQEVGPIIWRADDTIREAYNLSPFIDQNPRKQGLQGWIESRMNLVESGWCRLLEASRAMVKRLGDPIARLVDQPIPLHPLKSRWRRIQELEESMNSANQQAEEGPSVLRKPMSKGFQR